MTSGTREPTGCPDFNKGDRSYTTSSIETRLASAGADSPTPSNLSPIQIAARLSTPMKKARQTLASREPSKAQLVQQLHALLSAILDMLLESDVTEAWALFVMREQANPTAAFKAIFEKTQRPVIRLCIALVARLLRLPEDNSQVNLTALGLYGQITFFRFGRESVLRVTDAKKLGRAHLEAIKAVLFRQLTYLGDASGSHLPKKRQTGFA